LAMGGGSKSNIDAVFSELRGKAVVASKEDVCTEVESPSVICEPRKIHSTQVQHWESKNVLSFAGLMAKKPLKVASLRLDNEKDWIVEHFKDEKEMLKVEGAKITHNLQVRACENVTVHVTEKLNNVIIESCKKTNIILTGLISSVELIHCDKVKLQVLGKCPSVNMDNCSGIALFVSKEGTDVSITSSRSCDMNINFPIDDNEEEWKEVPIPQQFVHKITKDYQVDSRVSDLYR